MIKPGDRVYIDNKSYVDPYCVGWIDGIYATLIGESNSDTFKIVIPVTSLIKAKNIEFNTQLKELVNE